MVVEKKTWFRGRTRDIQAVFYLPDRLKPVLLPDSIRKPDVAGCDHDTGGRRAVKCSCHLKSPLPSESCHAC
jgi:hypothetical protein